MMHDFIPIWARERPAFIVWRNADHSHTQTHDFHSCSWQLHASLAGFASANHQTAHWVFPFTAALGTQSSRKKNAPRSVWEKMRQIRPLTTLTWVSWLYVRQESGVTPNGPMGSLEIGSLMTSIQACKESCLHERDFHWVLTLKTYW